MVEKLVQTGEAIQGLLAIQRLLTEAELAEVEAIIEACVAQAHADVNESYQQQSRGFRFKNGRFPNDMECSHVLRVDEKGERVTLAQELGVLKHAAAFACIEERLPKSLRDHFSTEPRYKGNPKVNGPILTNNRLDSLKPDLVLHAARNATNIQCVFEFKFPCLEKHRLDAMSAPWVKEQLKSYLHLSKNCRVVLITPRGRQSYEGD